MLEEKDNCKLRNIRSRSDLINRDEKKVERCSFEEEEDFWKLN